YVVVFFFVKQKTAYEFSRDWSSDVCSSDLSRGRSSRPIARVPRDWRYSRPSEPWQWALRICPSMDTRVERRSSAYRRPRLTQPRSEERRVGKGCGTRIVQDMLRQAVYTDLR